MEMLSDLTQSVQAISGIAHNLRALLDRAKNSGVGDEFTRELNEAIIAMQDTVIAAQRAALEAQATQTRLALHVDELEKQIASLGNWTQEAARYELADTYDTSAVGIKTAYRLRHEAKREDEPTHWICPNCYEDSVKSILQRGALGYQCLRCTRKRR